MNIIQTISSFFPASQIDTNICIAAILKEEDKFIDEWLAYHRLLGVNHFYLYDNDPRLPLKTLTQAHGDYVTVIDWPVEHDDPLHPAGTKQIKAYKHFLKNFGEKHTWVAFLDADEFITLRKHNHLKTFLKEFAHFDAISLQWHVFGHNGYYNDPKGFILASLTRRMTLPSARIKTISKIQSITDISSAHYCHLKSGSRRVDPNKKKFQDTLYPGKTAIAHINHYQFRSFRQLMSRPLRGEVGCVAASTNQGHTWRFEEEKCLEYFVSTVAKDGNELVDEYMLKYIPSLTKYLRRLKSKQEQTNNALI